MTDTNQRHFLTVLELAEYLRVSRTTAYQLVRDGEVPSIRVGGQLRVPRTDLDRRLAATTGETAA